MNEDHENGTRRIPVIAPSMPGGTVRLFFPDTCSYRDSPHAERLQ